MPPGTPNVSERPEINGSRREGKIGAPGAALKPKFRVYGEEMIEKEVRPIGNTGRVYLPPDWVGKLVKIIRIS